MSNYLGGLVTPANVDAANSLSPDVLALLRDTVRAMARKAAGDRVPADDVAAVAVLQAAGMIEGGHTLSTAAAAAVKVATVAALRDADSNGAADSTTVPLESTEDDNGAPLLRLASPYAPDPAAPYRTTTTDRYTRSLASLDGLDGVTAHALLSAEWKGGKVPAAAVRRALGLSPVTGRAGTAWTAAVTEDAARVLPALQDAYRDALTFDAQGVEGWEPVRTYGAPRRGPVVRTYSATRRHGDAYRAVPRTDDGTEPRREDSRATSGPASAPRTFDRRAADRLGILDGSARRKATEDDRRAATEPSRLLTVPPYGTAPGQAKQERGTFDYVRAAEPSGARIPGVSVDAAGVAVAGSGVASRGSGTGKAATRPAAPRKASRTGGTGATIPAGPRR